MRFIVISLMLSGCFLATVADITHVKAAKAKIIGRLLNKGRHHKRGILSSVPSYKLGHDIPHVTHSLVKPLVVTYPPTATVAAVKIPLSNPHAPHYPVHIGHKAPLPHPHYGFKYPHTKFIANSDQHFHHHHHHVSPTPIVPVIPAAPPAPVVPVVPHAAAVAPVVPVPQPTAVIDRPIQVPSSPWLLPGPVFGRNPLPLAAPPVHIYNPHLKPLLPAAAVAIPPASVLPAPALPLPQRFPYVIRPGGAVQTSVFATYPRYPFLNSYQSPLIPFSPSNAISSVQQVLYERPQLQLYPQVAAEHGIIEQHAHSIAVDQTPAILQPQPVSQPDLHLHQTHLAPQPELHLHQTHLAPQPEFHLHQSHISPQPELHLHPTQIAPQPEFHLHSTHIGPQPEFHLQPTQETLPQNPIHLHPPQEVPQPTLHFQPTHATIPLDHNGWSPVPAQPQDVTPAHQPEAHYPQQSHHFTQEQGTQVYEHHSGNQYHDLQHQLQHHIQQQIEQAQYEQNLNNQQTLQQEYGVPQQNFGEPNEYHQPGQDFSQAHDYNQNGQDFSQIAHDYHQQGQDFSQQGQNFAQSDYDVANHGHEYGLPQQGVEGRSEDSDQQFHNHIPLALQPPLDRPLEHFR